MTSEIAIFEQAGQLWTTSREVAARFGRRYDAVLQAMQSLECSDEFRRNNFVVSFYRDAMGKNRMMGFISRSGLSVLITGSGGKALAAMAAFLEAFRLASLKMDCSNQAITATTH